ncbi:hypothetical protein [Ewingella americana]|uniref:Uncharacterized protein n=1 Tax=Ewingella americana TaxID=41202 RepID=A0A502GDJ2_9GAMM|nr:hypothetical protein [Ewingella americana]TPG59985.1 hypothetical protein EAH77_15575 [Ewingella americana]
MISIFELANASLEKVSEIIGVPVTSVNIVARELPADGRKVLWITRKGSMRAGCYVAETNNVNLSPHLEAGWPHALSDFHFWVELADSSKLETFQTSMKTVETDVLASSDPIGYDNPPMKLGSLTRHIQYLGEFNLPPYGIDVLFVDDSGTFYAGWYDKDDQKVHLNASEELLPISEYQFWLDLNLGEVGKLVRKGTRRTPKSMERWTAPPQPSIE